MEIPHSQQFFAAYTAKDLILYALSVGYGDEDLKFVFEHDPDFQAVPTFPFVLAFWAQQQQKDHGRSSNDRMQPFPPNMMQEVGKDCTDVKLVMGMPLGFDRLLVDLVAKRISECAGRPDVRSLSVPTEGDVVKG